MKALANLECPVCGSANQCVPAQAGTLNVDCWCSKTTISAEALARVPEDLLNKACLCPRCAAGRLPQMTVPGDSTDNGTAP